VWNIAKPIPFSNYCVRVGSPLSKDLENIRPVLVPDKLGDLHLDRTERRVDSSGVLPLLSFQACSSVHF
jgi:hypothetical protein